MDDVTIFLEFPVIWTQVVQEIKVMVERPGIEEKGGS